MKDIIKIVLIVVFAMPLLASCEESPQPLTVTPSEITLYSEGTRQITTNLEGATFYSQDEWYAEVNASGIVTANYVGKTSITVSVEEQIATIPVTVQPAYVLYPDLDVFVGKSKAEVISSLGQPDIDKNNSLSYEYNDYAPLLGFYITNGYVDYAVAFVPNKYMSKLTSMIMERYAPVGMQNDEYYFVNHDKNVLVGLTVYNITYMGVVYNTYTGSKSNGFEKPDISEFLNTLNEQ